MVDSMNVPSNRHAIEHYARRMYGVVHKVILEQMFLFVKREWLIHHPIATVGDHAVRDPRPRADCVGVA
jgi:hypothetical protein